VNRLTSYFNGTATTSYAYDSNGNRLSSTLSGTTTYNYTASTNKLSSLTGTTTQSFTYNSDGNQTYDGTHTWSYDGRGLAVSVTAAAATTTYGINGFGERLSKTATGITGGKNEYVYDEQGNLLGEYGSTGTAIEETVYLPNTLVATLLGGTGIKGFSHNPAPIAVMTGSGATIYSTSPDWRNAPHLIYDATKVLAWGLQPNPFGAGTPSGTLTYNKRPFPGQYADSESSTAWNNARIYNLDGRYLQSDPIGLGASLRGTYSTYPYVGSNPLTRTDQTGQQSAAPVIIAIVAAVWDAIEYVQYKLAEAEEDRLMYQLQQGYWVYPYACTPGNPSGKPYYVSGYSPDVPAYLDYSSLLPPSSPNPFGPPEPEAPDQPENPLPIPLPQPPRYSPPAPKMGPTPERDIESHQL